jgi:hypothetical protein
VYRLISSYQCIDGPRSVFIDDESVNDRSVRSENTTNSTNVTNSSFSLLLFKGGTTGYQLPPAATLDNAGLGLNFYTERDTFVHKTASATIAATTLGTSSGWCGAHGIAIPFDLLGNSSDLYGMVLAEAAYTPASAQTFSVNLDIEKY